MTVQSIMHPKPKAPRHPTGVAVPRTENLNDYVYRILKNDILACDLGPGEEISEGVLVERYGFSKAPIRNALMWLRQEGLVVSRRRLGNIVAPITLQDVHEIYQLRVILEVEATRLAAGKVDARRLKELDDAVHGSYAPNDRASRAAYREANRAFHRYIAEASGNRRLAAMVVSLVEQHERIVHYGLALQDRDHEFHHYHDDLVATLVEGDQERAAQITVRAIRGSQEKILGALLSMADRISLRGSAPPPP